MNVTREGLEEKFPGEGMDRFAEIVELGGFGVLKHAEPLHIDASFAGGLDLVGVLDPANKAISAEAKKRIAELAGVTAAKHEPESSASKMRDTKETK